MRGGFPQPGHRPRVAARRGDQQVRGDLRGGLAGSGEQAGRLPVHQVPGRDGDVPANRIGHERMGECRGIGLGQNPGRAREVAGDGCIGELQIREGRHLVETGAFTQDCGGVERRDRVAAEPAHPVQHPLADRGRDDAREPRGARSSAGRPT
jgi:hypothetical protein